MGLCLRYSLPLVPKAETPCYRISFCVSLLIWCFSASRTPPPANQLCNIHQEQRCCCATAGCQPLPLIAPVFHVEARGGKRKKKAERVCGGFVRQARHSLKQLDRRLISSDPWLDVTNPTSELVNYYKGRE